MSPLEMLFSLLGFIGTLASLGWFIYRRGASHGRDQEKMKAANVRISAIEDVDRKVQQILIALQGQYGQPGLVARVSSIEGMLGSMVSRLEKVEREVAGP